LFVQTAIGILKGGYLSFGPTKRDGFGFASSKLWNKPFEDSHVVNAA